MKVHTRTCWMVAFLTLVTSVAPLQEVVAGDLIGTAESFVRAAGKAKISDVELMAGGILSGQALDTTGKPLVGQAIVVQQLGREPISTHSDQEGRFRLLGLNAGLCRVECGEAMHACRCWSPNTAPPAAARELLLINDESIERGQRPIGDLLSGPVLIGLIIAAAVIIPIAIHNSQKDAS